MKFTDRRSENIVNPCIGTEFNDCDEGYEYYNLYSWECGFGIRWGKKRWSEKKVKGNSTGDMRYQLGQEFYCSCHVSSLLFFSIVLSSLMVRNFWALVLVS